MSVTEKYKLFNKSVYVQQLKCNNRLLCIEQPLDIYITLYKIFETFCKKSSKKFSITFRGLSTKSLKDFIIAIMSVI